MDVSDLVPNPFVCLSFAPALFTLQMQMRQLRFSPDNRRAIDQARPVDQSPRPCAMLLLLFISKSDLQPEVLDTAVRRTYLCARTRLQVM